ncbi:MAG: VC0807 family protein, partial [Caulobacteraceae bacterium]
AARAWARRSGPGAALEIRVNVAAPFAIYSLARAPLGDAGALMAASAPPILWSVVEFARRRRIDALSLLVLAGIALSLLAFIGGGGVRFLQLREQLVGAVIGLVFLVSAAIGKPLVFQLAKARAKRRAASDVETFEAIREAPLFRRTMTTMTLVWGFGLLASAAVCGALVFALTIREYLLVSPIVGYGAVGALSAWSFWFARRRIGALRRRLEAEATLVPGVKPS